MRICFVCNEYPPCPHGGIGTMTRVLARELAQNGHEVRVVGSYTSPTFAADFEEDGVQICRLKTPNGPIGWLQARYQVYRKVRQWALDGEIELIEVPDWAGWAAGWPRLPVPVVVRLNGSATYFAAELGRQPGQSTFWLERSSFRRADYWCSVSQYTADKTPPLFGLSTKPDAVLFNPVNVPALVAKPQRSKAEILFTGTVTQKKGVISLLRAWPQVVRACPEAELRIYGKDGQTDRGTSMREYLLSLLDANSAARVSFLGHQPREVLYQALQRARVAVFPSYAEAFALAPLEAMACGCPTVYSKRGSGPEVIEPERDGLLVDPDCPDEIADALIRLLADNELASRLGESGRLRVQSQFDVKVLIKANEAFFQHCIEDFVHGRNAKTLVAA